MAQTDQIGGGWRSRMAASRAGHGFGLAFTRQENRMKRLFSFVVAAAAALAFSAAPASADQALKFEPGPPLFTGDFEGRGALVLHCTPLNPGEGPGVVVSAPAGVRGNCLSAE
jgi:hypothetical protein